MFNTICDKYEEVSSQLKENQTQLHIAKSALNKHQKDASKIRKYSNAQTQTQTYVSEGIEDDVENELLVDLHSVENTTLAREIEDSTENESQAEANGVEKVTQAKRFEDVAKNNSLSFFKSVTHLDHPYATTKPFSCKFCTRKFTRKHSQKKHILICKVRQTFNHASSDDDEAYSFENNPILYSCRVCDKQYTYDKMRKHYSQFINSSGSRKNRNGHGEVSLSTHISYMNELKANKPKKK